MLKTKHYFRKKNSILLLFSRILDTRSNHYPVQPYLVEQTLIYIRFTEITAWCTEVELPRSPAPWPSPRRPTTSRPSNSTLSGSNISGYHKGTISGQKNSKKHYLAQPYVNPLIHGRFSVQYFKVLWEMIICSVLEVNSKTLFKSC